MKHFKLTAETKVSLFGVTLFRIEATIDGHWGKAGTKGGWVEKEENIDQVYGDAWVYGNAQVYGDARVYGNAQVYGDARVSGDAQVYGNARVSGDARVSGNARVSGDARVYGNAQVYGDARVYGNAQVYGDARVSGDAQVYGNAQVYGDARVYGNARVYGDARVSGDAWEKSPLQIQGTRHFINVFKRFFLRIGCHEFSFEYWRDNFEDIGKNNGYTEEQIREYGMYIHLAINIYGLKEKVIE